MALDPGEQLVEGMRERVGGAVGPSLQVETDLPLDDLQRDLQRLLVAQEQRGHVAGQVVLGYLTGGEAGQQGAAPIEGCRQHLGAEILQLCSDLGAHLVGVAGGVGQRGAGTEGAHEILQARGVLDVGRVVVHAGDRGSEADRRPVAHGAEVGAARRHVRGQHRLQRGAEYAAFPVGEHLPAEQAVLHAPPPPVRLAVQDQQAVLHDDGALVVHALAEVFAAVCLARLGPAGQDDRIGPTREGVLHVSPRRQPRRRQLGPSHRDRGPAGGPPRRERVGLR